MSKKVYKSKQEWIEAVMASDLSLATKVYAFGIFKHMYGVKTDAFPGAKGISEATALNNSQFYKYNKMLSEAGFLEVTSVEGRSNRYDLLLPPSTEGGYPPQQRVGSPPQRVGPPSTEGTNTTSNTTKKTSREDNNNAPSVASAPNDTWKDFFNFSFRDDDPSLWDSPNKADPIYFVDLTGVTKQLDPPSPEGGTEKEYEDGEKYLERLIEKNNVHGADRSLARRRYADEDYEPTLVGLHRAAWVLRHLSDKVTS